MSHAKLDLNLLVALRCLLAERNVARAAHSLKVTEPAMACMLARLREHFGDALIEPVGKRMALTPLAEGLVQPVGDILQRIDATLGQRPVFDPAQSRRHFSIVASDYVVQVLIADVLATLQQQAPGITVELRQPSPAALAELDAGELDFLIAPEHFVRGSQTACPLFEDNYCAVVDRDHPDIGASLDLPNYLLQGHVAFHNQGKPYFESWFECTHGHARRVEVTAHNFSILPRLVAGTRRVATMHRRLAELLAQTQPVKLVSLDFETPKIVEVLLAHRYRELDAGGAWMRGLIRDRAQALSLPR
jgi:DNA-binding transcriptional LysR family regulator